MAGTILTDARVRAFKPHKAIRDIRDGELRGFGVRVSHSGRKQFFIQCQHRGERVWKIIGNAGSMSVAEARTSAQAGEEALDQIEPRTAGRREMAVEARVAEKPLPDPGRCR